MAGLGAIARFVTNWRDGKRRDSEFLLITYRDLAKSLQDELNSIRSHLNSLQSQVSTISDRESQCQQKLDELLRRSDRRSVPRDSTPTN